MDPREKYAIMGVQARLGELIEEIAGLRNAFPELALEPVLSAIVAAKEELRSGAPVAAPVTNGERKHKATTEAPRGLTRRKTGSSLAGATRAWTTGREVLVLLAHSKKPMPTSVIMSRLRLEGGTALWRLRRRLDRGHVLKIQGGRGNGGEARWEITAKGRTALARDEDTEV